MDVVSNAAASSSDSNLSQQRQRSSIPIAASQLPQHQADGAEVWMYPSEQQFYNAMKRKVGAASMSSAAAVLADSCPSYHQQLYSVS
jgi:hypothetical protein